MIFLIQVPEGDLVYISESVNGHLGYSPEELMGNSIYELLPSPVLKWIDGLFSEPSQNDGKTKVVVTHLPTRGEKELPVEMTLRKVTFHNTHYCVAVARDITERKLAEDALRRSHDELEKRVAQRTAELFRINLELERSNQALQDFTSIASHDLQEPLRKIETFSERLKKRYASSLGEEGCDYLERMQNASRRMKALIESLLDYSRVTTRAEPFVKVDLQEVAQSVLVDLEVRIEAEHGTVQIGELPIIEADPNQIHQLFQNLIGNALKYHDEKRPVVQVYSRNLNNGTFEVHFKDNGIGFDMEHVERIFAPFLRLHGKSSNYAGTGMGLAICKKIVERHGGSITAESKPGEGSTFIVTLPLKQADKCTPATTSVSACCR
jgi:PAS domain S-box-containing protein